MKIRVSINPEDLKANIMARLSHVTAPKGEAMRRVVTDLVPMVHQRIHVDGKAADGQQIGQYSNSYMKVRTGNYGNAAKYSKGAKAGKTKNAGTYTKGGKAGAARPKYNRSNDRKIILSLTRQMENDYAVLPTETGWGIGFNNEHNADKARWNNKRKGREVYALTEEEITYACEMLADLLNQEFNP